MAKVVRKSDELQKKYELYKSDSSVVSVSGNGTVTAIGKGTAYVVIKSNVGNMFEICKYVVNG